MDTNTNEETNGQTTYNLSTTFLNPTLVLILFGGLIILLVGVAYLGGSSNEDPYGSSYGADEKSGLSKTISKIVGAIVIIMFIFLSVAIIAQYVLKIDVVTNMKNLFSDNPEIDIEITKPPEESPKAATEDTGLKFGKKFRKEVFNIPGNNFVQDDAKALCSAYGARLATYQEMEKSYNDGADWCNYGWSEGQMALYPTQQKTWDGLQKIEGHENDCGRPGVNGGYMKNPAMRFGANCFGYKPTMTTVEEELMANTTPYPKTKKDMAIAARTEYWKKKITDILVSPFNYKNWSKL